MPGNRVGSRIKGLESKFVKILYIYKNILVPTSSSFAAIDYKGHFRKVLTRFSSLSAFLGTTPTFLKKNETGYLKQNLMLNQLSPISNPKNEKAKSPYPLF